MVQQGQASSSAHEGGSTRRRADIRSVLVIIVVAAVVAAGVTYGLHIRGFLPFDENRVYSHTYTLKVDTDILEEYTLTVPIPLNRTGAPYPGFLDELVNPKENLGISIVDTPHGKALTLTGSQDATLWWEASWGTDEGDWYLNLSMTGEIDTVDGFDTDMMESWICSDRDDLRVSLSYYSERIRMVTPVFASGGGPCYTLTGNDGDLTLELQAGWQNASIEYGYSIIN